jgi:uroporphyrinogen III methyltransferase/synthase
VEAYRTVPSLPDTALLDDAADADAVVFTSPSTVDAFVDVMGARRLPTTVVCIGPSTAAAAARRGLSVAVVPSRRDAAGLADALVAHVRAGPGGGPGPQ